MAEHIAETFSLICSTFCYYTVGLNTALLQISFLRQWNLWKYWPKKVRFFVGNPKICLSSWFANTCASPNPKKRYTFFGSPGILGHLFSGIKEILAPPNIYNLSGCFDTIPKEYLEWALKLEIIPSKKTLVKYLQKEKKCLVRVSTYSL